MWTNFFITSTFRSEWQFVRNINKDETTEKEKDDNVIWTAEDGPDAFNLDEVEEETSG